MLIHKTYNIFSKYFRKKRMYQFENIFMLSDEKNVLDVGGGQYNWQFVNCKPKITVVNISKPRDWDDETNNFNYEFGDGTNLKYINSSFDIVYSNSVIEHLKTWERQKMFAKEIMRVGKAYYVQTPAKEFFFEPHFLTPFIHWLPLEWQRRFLRNFTLWGLITRPTSEDVNKLLEEIKLLSYKEFKELFPDAEIVKEKFIIFTKSYMAIRHAY